MKVTSSSVQVAASARVIAGQVGAIAGFCCGDVFCVSTAALHQLPHDKDGGIVALRDGGDTREGAGGWGGGGAEFRSCDTSINEYRAFLSLGLKSVTCLQLDGSTRLTLTLAVFSNNAEIIKNTTRQVLHLTCSVTRSGAVGCVVFSTCG